MPVMSHFIRCITAKTWRYNKCLFPSVCLLDIKTCFRPDHSFENLVSGARSFSSFLSSSTQLSNSGVLIQNRMIELRPKRFDRIFFRSAGHSHWHNIRHTKESKDAMKQKTASDTVRKIKLAVREGGSTNPKLNSVLARVLEEGKAKDVSNVTMLDVLKRLEKGKDLKGSQVFVEAKGIGNCMLIIETYTDRPKWMRQEVQHVMKQFGGRIGEAGTSAHSFRFKGVVYLPKDQGSLLSEDQALEVAIEVGAEEVIEGFDDDGLDSFQLICDPKQLHAVKKAMEERGLKPQAARLEYIPHVFTKLDEASLEVASRMLDSLEAMDDVVHVYDNIES